MMRGMSVTVDRLSREQWDERRRGRRFSCPFRIGIGPWWGVGHDISRGGVSVFMREPLPVGEVMAVNLGRSTGQTAEMSGAARVLRSMPHSLGYLVALQFVEQD
jgi:hypothetical protein